MKSRIFIYTIALTGCLWACQTEDELTPSNTPNSFTTSPEDVGEAKLKEEFYKATGCRLLFNDTLRHEYKGLDGNGNPVYETELLGLEYSLTGVSVSRFKFDYLQTLEQKRQAALFVQNDLVPYIKALLPYSLFVTNGIEEYHRNMNESSYEYAGSPLTYSNFRCLALSVNRLWELDVEARKSYAQDICCEMIFASFGGDPLYNYSDGKAGAFFQQSTAHYGNLKERFDWFTWSYVSYNPLEEGFLEDPYEAVFPSAKEDIMAYIKAYFSMTEEEFFAKYGPNDVNGYTRKKYDIIKPLLDATGIKFN